MVLLALKVLPRILFTYCSCASGITPVVIFVASMPVGKSLAAIVFQPGATPLVPLPVCVKNFFVVVVFGDSNVVVLVPLWYGIEPNNVVPLPPARCVA